MNLVYEHAVDKTKRGLTYWAKPLNIIL